MNITEPLIQKNLLRIYLEVINYLLKKFANNEVKAEMDSKILRYSEQAYMTFMRYADDLHGKSCKVANVFDESTLNYIFIESVNPSVFQSLRKYWATHPQADVTDIFFQAQ